MPTQGEMACLVAAGIWAFTITAYKVFGRNASALFLGVLKCLIAILFFLVLWLQHREPFPTGKTLLVLISSGFIGILISDLLFFLSLLRLDVQTAAAIQCLAPPLASINGYIFLGENLGTRKIIGVALTCFAVFLATFLSQRRSHTPENRRSRTVGLILAVTGVVGDSVAQTLSREGFRSAEVVPGTLSRLVPVALLLTIYYLFTKPKEKAWFPFETRTDRVGILVAAFFGNVVGLWLMSFGLKNAPVGIASTLLATYPIWVIPVARLWIKEPIYLSHLVAILVALSGIGILVTK